jgi:uncharacterized damage-inducible protein DinB
MRPEKNTYPEYYGLYIPLVKENNVYEALLDNKTMVVQLLGSIGNDQAEHAYAPGKWTIKQVFNHITDTERIIAYRALRFARKDPRQPLPFEEDDYAANSELSDRSLKDLQEEFESVRNATLSLFKSFSENVLLQKGNTHLGPATVLSLGFLICGHAQHHAGVIKERYLKAEEKITSN